jgi:transcription initiation factor IIE alpha subunit
MFFRFFSKKIYARSNENQLFLKIKKKILKPFRVIKMNINDKNHIYKKCSKCGTILKLPLQSKAGFKKAKCPKCNKKVRLFTFKKEKIEIVKKGVKNA